MPQKSSAPAGTVVRDAFAEPMRQKKPRPAPGLPPTPPAQPTGPTDEEIRQWDSLTRMFYDALQAMRGTPGDPRTGEKPVTYTLPKDLPIGRPVAELARKWMPIVEASPEIAVLIVLGPHSLTALLNEIENLQIRRALRAAAARDERRGARPEGLGEDHARQEIAVPT